MDTPPTGDGETTETTLGKLLADVVAMLDRAIDTRAKAIGVSGAQWVILMRIADQRGGTAAELCRSIGYDSGSMTRMLDRLERLGTIRRVRSDHDRRVVRLALTDAGQALVEELRPIATDVLGARLRGFTPGDVRQLMGYLNRMLKNGQGG